jgi:hypothetical protein
MHAQEKENYIRSAVDASPHKIAIISCKDHYEHGSTLDHITVAFYDQNHNLVFAKMAPGAIYSGNLPEKTFGNAEVSGVTLRALASNYQTVEAVPVDFSIKHGEASGKAKLFMADLEIRLTGANALNTTEEALQRAIEKVDASFGVSVKHVIEGVFNFKESYPEAAESLAKLLLQHVFKYEQSEIQFLQSQYGTATNSLANMMKDTFLPKTFVLEALQSAWDDLSTTFPKGAEALAEHLVKTFDPTVTQPLFTWTYTVKALAIPEAVNKIAQSQENWARENSSRVYDPEHATWLDAGKQAAPAPDMERLKPAAEILMGQRHLLQDHNALIETAVNASPTGVVVVGVKSMEHLGARKFDFQNPDGAFNHVLVAYRDPASNKILIAEMGPGNRANSNDSFGHYLNSSNKPGTLDDVVRMWDKFVAVPVALTPEQDKLFRESLAKNLTETNIYSFLKQIGDTCASGVKKAFVDAGVWDGQEKGIAAWLEKIGFNVVLPRIVIEWSKERGGVVYDSERFRTDRPDATGEDEEGASHSEQAPDGGGVKADGYRSYPSAAQLEDAGVKADNYKGPLAFAEAAIAQIAIASSAEKDASIHNADSENAASNANEEASHSDQDAALTETAKSELGASRHEAGPDDAKLAALFITAHGDSFPSSMFSQQGTQPQESATVNEDLRSDVLIKTDTESPSADDLASPAALTDSDRGSHSERTTTASDNDGATPKEGLTDGEAQVALETDASKDAGSHSEQPGIIPGEDILAPAKAAMETAKAFMETANPQEGANLTAHDQPVPHGAPTMSAIFGQQDSFPSSMFANIATPTQVLNQALTTEPQAPAVESPHPAAPETESLGNAVPSVTPVVHHDELAP